MDDLRAIKPLSYVKSKASQILDDLSSGAGPMVITQNGEAKAVLQSIEDFEQTQETLALLKLLALGQKEIDRDDVSDAFDVVREMRRANRSDQ